MSILKHYQSRYDSYQQEEYSIEEYLQICKEDSKAYATAAERILDAIGEPELVDTNSKDFDLDIDPRDGLSALRPPMNRNEGSRIMHGNAITHEDAG